jgi:hypothetical protein
MFNYYKIGKTVLSGLLLTLFLMACSSSQRVTSSWINKEAIPDEPYKTICIIALVPDKTAKLSIEDKMAKLLTDRGVKAVKSTELFPLTFTDNEEIPREKLVERMKGAGCDGIFTIAELDVKTEERYVPGTQPMPLPPFRYRYYNSYYSYYAYRYNQIYEPGYVTTETTYFFETNFYDLATENLLWSVQSEAFEPTGIDSWFQGYSSLLINQLKKEGMLAK